MKNVLVAILAIFLLLGAFAEPIMGGIKTWRTENITQAEVVATALGYTTANFTTDSELFQDDEAQVISISSSISETPVATSYDDDAQNILVSALSANTSRTLTVNYYAKSESIVMRAVGVFLTPLIIGFLVICCLLPLRKKKGRG